MKVNRKASLGRPPWKLPKAARKGTYTSRNNTDTISAAAFLVPRLCRCRYDLKSVPYILSGAAVEFCPCLRRHQFSPRVGHAACVVPALQRTAHDSSRPEKALFVSLLRLCFSNSLHNIALNLQCCPRGHVLKTGMCYKFCCKGIQLVVSKTPQHLHGCEGV